MKMTIHPLFLLLLLFVVLTGNIALYSVVLISLLIHELGHIIAAKMVGAQIQACILMPYGGEMLLKNELQLTHRQRMLIALGGPIATIAGLLISFMLPALLKPFFWNVQLFLLLVNLLPIWPLDGGRIVCFTLLMRFSYVELFEYYVSISFYLLTVIIIVLLYSLPQTLSLVVVSLFLWSKLLNDWKNRKYRSAFEKHVMNRLT